MNSTVGSQASMGFREGLDYVVSSIVLHDAAYTSVFMVHTAHFKTVLIAE